MRLALVAIALSYMISICGFAQTQPASSGLSINPTKVDFGRHAVNSQGQPVTIILSNRSQAPVAIQEILSSGIDFRSQNNCAEQLAAESQCTILVSFKPVIVGDRIGILQITASDSPNSHFIPLGGIGNAQ